jgi:hypothetical protein
MKPERLPLSLNLLDARNSRHPLEERTLIAR